MSSQYIDIPAYGSHSWKSPVNTATSLPASGNSLGDARVAQDTGVIYVWTGSAWQAEGGVAGVSSLNTLTGSLTLVAGANITITPSGSNITIASTGGGGGSGTVTSVSVVTANGLSGTVANPTTTPAITLTGTLTGDITGTLNSNALTATTNSTLTTLSALSLPFTQLSGQATLAQLPSIASDTVLGNVTGGSAVPTALSKTQLTTLINAFTSSLSGAVPASGGGTTNFLRADGTFAAPPGASYTFADSLVNTGGTVTLKGDTASPTASQYYGTNGSSTLGYYNLPSAGTGTVTSVALSDGSTNPIYSISGSPVTTSGTLTFTLATQTANTVLAGPTTGSAAQPAFRALVAADLPTGNLTDAGTDGIVVTGGTGAVIGSGTSIAQHVADTTHNGYLSSTDWNTFNGKGSGTVTAVSVASANGFAGSSSGGATPALTLTTTVTGILQGNGTAISAATTGNLTDAGTDGITVTGGTGAVLGSGTSLSQHVADTTHNGYLSSTDWNTFNGKGSGTVTSVAMTVPSFLSVSGSPITSSGTLAVTLSGTALPIANGGTGQTGAAAAFIALSPLTTKGDIIYEDATPTPVRLAIGSTGNVLTVSGGIPTWAAPATSGTVTSVALSTPGVLYTVSGSPITTSGTLTLTLNTQSANTVFAGPTTGAAATPTFRALVAADLPAGTGTVTSVAMTVPSFLSVSGSPITSSGTLAVTLSGTALPIANGGTGQTSASAAFNALSPMTTGGDIIYGGASGVGTRLANGSNGQVLTSSGGTSAPTWTSAGSGTVTSIATNNGITGGTITTTGTIGLAAINNGSVLGNVSGSSATPTALGIIFGSGGYTPGAIVGTDGFGNALATGFNPKFSTTATAAGTTNLTFNNNQTQEFTGTTTQTVVLPNATTATFSGYIFTFINNSTGAVTIQNHGASTLLTMAASTWATFINSDNTTSNGVWDISYQNKTPPASGVTSVGMSVPSFLSVSGSPITSSGTLAVTLSGTALPVANGGTGQITAAAAFSALSPITTTGDIIYSSSGTTNSRLGIGSTGNVLTVAGGVPTWAAPAAPVFSGLNTDGIIYATSATAVASTAVGTAGQVLTSNGTGVAPTFQNAPGGGLNYYQGYQYVTSNGNWSTSSTTFANMTTGGSVTTTTRKSSGLTVTAASGSVPGITFTPASASSVYLITAQFNATGTVGGTADGGASRLYDGTTVITQGPYSVVSVTQGTPISLTGVYAPATTSPVTVQVQMYVNNGSFSTAIYCGAANSQPATGVEWTIVEIV